jgi:glycosyltransferase involved in cell wall biosynthesis
MTRAPEVSVVMSAYNSADSLVQTLDSVLDQEGINLEFIVVNDGSSDGTGELLDNRAKADARLKIIHQDNSGLTMALVKGCQQARGRFIARQDAGGDISLPGRLLQQANFLKSHPDAVMVSCGTRFVGPDDRFLFDVVMDDKELATGLSTLKIPGIRGPSSHPSAMFTREAYERCGGYRPIFVVAQDIDLWLRMYEVGACLTLPDVLVQARYSIGISSRLRGVQLAYCRIAIECARFRRNGLPEPEFPASEQSWATVGQIIDPDETAKLHYFLGSCLLPQDRKRARAHFWTALNAKPTHIRALMRVIQSYFPRVNGL